MLLLVVLEELDPWLDPCEDVECLPWHPLQPFPPLPLPLQPLADTPDPEPPLREGLGMCQPPGVSGRGSGRGSPRASSACSIGTLTSLSMLGVGEPDRLTLDISTL